MTRRNKRILGCILVAIYIIGPFTSSTLYWNSHIEYWSWANFIFAIAIWEFLVRDWLFKD